MKVLVIGGGAREHALCRSLSLDPDVTALHCAPGNAGIAEVAELHPVDALDGAAVAELAAGLAADLVVVGPEAPLVAGRRRRRARRAASRSSAPPAEAAQLEGSKAFAKDVMAAAGVPTARSYVCTTPEEVDEALDAFGAAVRRQGRRPRRRQGRRRHRRPRRGPRARAAPATAWSSRSSSTAPRSRSSRSPTARPSSRSSPPRTSSAPTTATRAPTPAAWARTRRCPGPTPSWSTRSWTTVLQPTVDELRRRGTPVLRAALRGSGDHLARRARHRVQRPLRRPGDPGRAGPPEDPARRAAARRRHRHPRRPRRRCAGATTRRSPWSSPRTTTRTPRAPATRSTGSPRSRREDGPEAYVLHAGTKRDDGGAVLSAGGRVLSVTATGSDLTAGPASAPTAPSAGSGSTAPSTARTSRRRPRTRRGAR